VPGPATSSALRAVGLAERALLVEGALHEARVDRSSLMRDERSARVLLDSCVAVASGAVAGARVRCGPTGVIEGVEVRLAAGDPLDAVVLRSYAIGAAHMALGWVLTEGLAVDATTGEIHDLTIRSFGILRARDTPPIQIEIVDDPGEARGRASEAVFAAVAAATWNVLTDVDGDRPEAFPARTTRAARALRR
jgi:CO/xanthine dehydrogenase Mo-binding subunit